MPCEITGITRRVAKKEGGEDENNNVNQENTNHPVLEGAS